MSEPKNTFQQDADKSGQWRAIVNGDLWADVLLHSRSEFLDREPTPEQQKGAKMFVDILTTIADPEKVDLEGMKKGLHHNLDNPKPVQKPVTPKKEK
jgi:hypothetical protein